MAGVYISYPFCAQKCSFCNFASGVQPRGLAAEYVNSLLQEIGNHPWHWKPNTVYLGGGTPSEMSAEAISILLGNLPGTPWAEATMEAAPGSLTPEKVRAWVAAGINRVSLGVQSFVAAELSRTGRKHNAQIVESDCALLKSFGIDNINLDLIAGLPGQTAQSWRESLDWIERLSPPHVSVYLFELDADSRLGLEILNNGSRYGAHEVPSDDAMADFYEFAVERLARLGIPRYEISNFARPGRESLHNLKYWDLEPYAGFGADAHSFDGATRSCNVETAREYVDQMKASGFAESEANASNPIEERFFVGLRLSKGIHPAPEEWRRFEAPIRRFVNEGLLETDGSHLRLTNRGVLLSNEVLQEFVNL